MVDPKCPPCGNRSGSGRDTVVAADFGEVAVVADPSQGNADGGSYQAAGGLSRSQAGGQSLEKERADSEGLALSPVQAGELGVVTEPTASGVDRGQLGLYDGESDGSPGRIGGANRDAGAERPEVDHQGGLRSRP
jgi:hypothetical protein